MWNAFEKLAQKNVENYHKNPKRRIAFTCVYVAGCMVVAHKLLKSEDERNQHAGLHVVK